MRRIGPCSTIIAHTKEGQMSAITTPLVLEPAAQQFADANANPPYLFDLGPEKGRETVERLEPAASVVAAPPHPITARMIITPLAFAANVDPNCLPRLSGWFEP
jgi:hypothetical protein